MTVVLRPNTVDVSLGSGSQGSLTFNANNPTIPATLQVTTTTAVDTSGRGSGLSAFTRRTSSTTTYTQSATDGLFRDSNGDLWSGETPGSGMTASLGSTVRQQMGQAINNNDDISNAQRNSWASGGLASLATGVNPVPGNNTSTAGGTDQGLNRNQINGIGGQAFSGIVHNRNFGNLRYPITLQSDTDFMKIVMKRYVPGEFRTGLGARANERRMTSQGTVILPIPNALRDSNKTNWGSHSMNDIQAKAADAGLELMGREEDRKSTEQLTELLKDKATETTAKTQLLSQLPGIKATGNQIRARAAGSVLNPNLELLFNGPAMRAFDYSVRMTPRGPDEAIMVKKIIRFFKEGSAAKVTTASMYLQTPNVFQVSFHSGGGGEHPWLGKMKVAALASVGVNYVPDGTYMTLPNASMTAYEITLNFQELDPILDTDYLDVDLQFGELNHIGY